jgi:hypothetical protein
VKKYKILRSAEVNEGGRLINEEKSGRRKEIGKNDFIIV